MVSVKQWILSAATGVSLVMAGSVLAADAGAETPTIMSPAKIAARTQPAAKVCVQGEACGGAAPATVAAAAPAATQSPDKLYNSTCSACHATGAAGAPTLGDKTAWAARIAQGKETLYTHAIAGFNMMPPKGTCGACSDADIKGVVDYMVEKSQ